MKSLIMDLFLTIVMRRLKWLKTKSLTWMVETIKYRLMKVVMKTMAVLIVNTLIRILTKKARNLKENASGLIRSERNEDEPKPDYTYENFWISPS